MSLLELDKVSFAYPGHAPVLNEASLSLAPGERVSITGPNGVIGRAVICALVAQILVAMAAAIVHLEIGMQQFSLTAIWAAQTQASPDCWLEGADVLLGQAGVSHGDSYVIVGRR